MNGLYYYFPTTPVKPPMPYNGPYPNSPSDPYGGLRSTIATSAFSLSVSLIAVTLLLALITMELHDLNNTLKNLWTQTLHVQTSNPQPEAPLAPSRTPSLTPSRIP